MVTTGFYDRAGDRDSRFAFQYGQIEIRCRLPAGKGLWPALWLLPAAGKPRPEIDIMELLGDSPNLLRLHVHYDETAQTPGEAGQTVKTRDLTKAWHVFGLRWEANAVIWYLDGLEVWRYKDARRIPMEPMYLLMNLAVGGNYPGAPDKSTKFPAEFAIDYVRIWQRTMP